MNHKTLLDLVNQAGDDDADSEDDVDFVPDSTSSSEGGDDDIEPQNAASCSGQVEEHNIAQIYEALKAEVQLKPRCEQDLVPGCQSRFECNVQQRIPEQPSHRTGISFQPQNLPTNTDWRTRKSCPILTVDFAKNVMDHMERDFNHIRKRRMRFAGKLYDIEVDPKTQRQKLTTCEEDDEAITEIQRVLISKPETMTAMAKSRADWQVYMRETDEAFKLKQHRKSTGAVLRKKIFLQNVAAAASSSVVEGRRRRRAT